MKSFNDHIDKKPENLHEEDPFDALTGLLGVAAAGAGLWAMKKGWDKWGKGSVVANALAITKTQKAKVAQDKLDKIDQKKKEKETIAKGKLADKDTDKEGKYTNQKDAQAYKDETGEAPDGWVTSPKKSPSKGEVWTTKDQEKWDAGAEKRTAAKKKKTLKKQGKAAVLKKSGTKPGEDKPMSVMQMTPAQKAKKLADFKKKKAQQQKNEINPREFQRFALHELISLIKEDRTQLLEELVLEETMSLEESIELQAIMALDDAGIKADINRKGQVVIKKKDKKKAHKALEKSFTKGGWPPLKLEDVEEGVSGPTRMEIQKFFDKEKGTQRARLNKTADAFNIYEIIVNKEGTVVGYQLDKRHYKKFKEEVEIEEIIRPRTAYEVVSEARNRAAKNKPEWETEDSRLS